MPRNRNYDQFPVNDAGEPLMDARDWLNEQYHDADMEYADMYDDDGYADYAADLAAERAMEMEMGEW